MERKSKATGEKNILLGESMKSPGHWFWFLANYEKNKSQLVGMLLQVWSSDKMAAKLKGRNVCTEKNRTF